MNMQLAKRSRNNAALAAQTFIDIMFSLPWFNQPNSPSILQFDGVLASYLAHFHVYLYQKHVETLSENELPLYITNFYDMFQTLSSEVFTPTKSGKFGEVSNQRVNKFIDSPLTELQARQRYHESTHEVYACAEKLWGSQIEEMNSKNEKVAICEGSQTAFRLAYMEALENFSSMLPVDVVVSEIAIKTLEVSRSWLKENSISISTDRWVNAYRRGYMKVWHHLATGQVQLKTIQNNLQKNIIGF